MARARARELMDLVGLDLALARRYPQQLSGGQHATIVNTLNAISAGAEGLPS